MWIRKTSENKVQKSMLLNEFWQLGKGSDYLYRRLSSLSCRLCRSTLVLDLEIATR